MIQRKTLLLGIRDEKEGIEYYSNLSKLSDNEEEKMLYRYIMNQEKEHLRILEHKLKNYTEKKGQTQIIKMLSIGE